MSYALNTCSSQSFNGEYDQYLALGGASMLRTITSAALSGWTEIWLGVRYRATALVTKAELTPISLPVGDTRDTVGLHLGLQSGLTYSPGTGASSLPHFLGIRNMLRVSATIKLATSAGGSNEYLANSLTPIHYKSGAETAGSNINYLYHPVEEFRGVLILRYVKGSPNWSVQGIHANTDVVADSDFTVTNLNDNFALFSTWADVVNYFTPFGYKESNIFTTVAVDEGTYGTLNVVSFRWNPRYWYMKCSDIFGVVKTS
jgi:hypothetical protein